VDFVLNYKVKYIVNFMPLLSSLNIEMYIGESIILTYITNGFIVNEINKLEKNESKMMLRVKIFFVLLIYITWEFCGMRKLLPLITKNYHYVSLPLPTRKKFPF